jgi:hypothetical protein
MNEYSEQFYKHKNNYHHCQQQQQCLAERKGEVVPV